MSKSNTEITLNFIDQQIAEVEADDRYHYKSANIQTNAPLALIQVDLKAKMRALQSVKAVLLEELENQLSPRINPNIATKILTGELELLPHEPTQEIYRLFMEGFESSEGENFAQKFKDGYRTMISGGVLDDE